MRAWLGVLAVSLLCAADVRAEQPASGQAEQPVGARGLSDDELARLAAQLGSPTPSARQAAVQALSSLHEESLAGVGSRLKRLTRGRPDPERIRTALGDFRRALGSRNAEDGIDIAPGVLPVLARDRSRAVLAAAEPVLLLRALERIASLQAASLMGQVLLLDGEGIWDRELRLSRERVGMPLLPALIALRSSDEPRVKSWAQAGVRALGMDDPSVATAIEDPALCAAVVRAYGEPLDFAAMPLIVRLVGADKLQIRQAARDTVQRFGKNAIWQLRELYAEVAGHAAERGWDTARVAEGLYVALDRETIETSETLLSQGLAKYVDGDLDAMQERFDRLLAADPRFEGRAKMAPGYAALGALRLQQDRLADARAANQRALRLAPGAKDEKVLKSQLAFIDAELALSQGVADLEGYRRALTSDPNNEAARSALDELSGESRSRERHKRKLAAMAALGLFAVAGLLLARGRPAQVEPKSAS